jgi:Putative transposase/Transposase zinc-binding domain
LGRNLGSDFWHASSDARRFVAALAPAYLPRRPTETVLYALVRQHLESFLAHAREHYNDGLPRYVEAELRAYLKCGVFSEGFTRARCDACGHDLLIAFSCKSRTVCPSCTGRRMANTASAVVDRVLPDVPVRQYVLTLPYELRKLVAFKADVLTAIGRIAVDAIFATYRDRAKRHGVQAGECGAINFVQRFGSLNLHVHFHIMVIDGVFTRDGEAGVLFHPASPPAREELDSIAQRVRDRSLAWLLRHGYLDERPLEERSNDPPAQTALDACSAIAMGRGRVATLPNADAQEDDHEQGAPGKPGLAVERDGFNLHAAVRIEAGDDLGRERLIRYGARPPLSLERLRRLPGGRVAYRLKYVTRGRGKFRVMTGIEFMARLAAIIAPPRYPLVRYAGVLGPRSAWR